MLMLNNSRINSRIRVLHTRRFIALSSLGICEHAFSRQGRSSPYNPYIRYIYHQHRDAPHPRWKANIRSRHSSALLLADAIADCCAACGKGERKLRNTRQKNFTRPLRVAFCDVTLIQWKCI